MMSTLGNILNILYSTKLIIRAYLPVFTGSFRMILTRGT
jgi:hypothetical protein